MFFFFTLQVSWLIGLTRWSLNGVCYATYQHVQVLNVYTVAFPDAKDGPAYGRNFVKTVAALANDIWEARALRHKRGEVGREFAEDG